MSTTIKPVQELDTPNQHTPSVAIKTVHNNARLFMSIMLAFSDAVSLALAVSLAVFIRWLAGIVFTDVVELLNPPLYLALIPIVLIYQLIYKLWGLYPAIGLGPVEELRRQITATSIVFTAFTAFTFWVRTAEVYSRLVIAFSWLLALIMLPVGRWITRSICVKLGIWGEPVAIVGNTDLGKKVIEFLISKPHLGLRPELIIVEDKTSIAKPAHNLPTLVIDRNDSDVSEIKENGIQTAMIIGRQLSDKLNRLILTEQVYQFKHLILISDLSWIGSLGVNPLEFEGLLGLEIRQNLLNFWDQGLKRLFDIIVSGFLILLGLPFYFLISVVIRIDSKGSPFYVQERIGQGGKKIRIWKFRTMHVDSDHLLSDYMSEHPEATSEWEETHKIKNDPRITRVGRVLRRFSLDELPQIWNVFQGEMSLVGPRPFLEDEIHHYEKGFSLYKRVRPGITGLWQVYGRAELSFAERVRYDEYYIRNWSIWLDIYILGRTVWTVLRSEGAY
jgi:Undecaprenyl-phosphate galactose phosphotransferase WbaP